MADDKIKVNINSKIIGSNSRSEDPVGQTSAELQAAADLILLQSVQKNLNAADAVIPEHLLNADANLNKLTPQDLAMFTPDEMDALVSQRPNRIGFAQDFQPDPEVLNQAAAKAQAMAYFRDNIASLHPNDPVYNSSAPQLDPMSSQRPSDTPSAMPESIRPPINNYSDAKITNSSIYNSLRDTYASTGRYSDVDGKKFNEEYFASQKEAGLISEGTLSPLEQEKQAEQDKAIRERKSTRKEIGIGLGYSAMQFGMGFSQISSLNHGQYVAPEERASAIDNGVLPAVGGAIGSLIPGMGFAGQFLGGAVGQIAASALSADNAQQQSIRETSERLVASLGLASESLGKFREDIQATGAPVAQLGAGLIALQGLAPGVGENAIKGAGSGALLQGEAFQQNISDTSKFLASSPALAPLASAYATSGGALTKDEFHSIAEISLLSGDLGAFNAAKRQEESARESNDPKTVADAKELEATKNQWSSQVNKVVANVIRHITGGKYESDSAIEDLERAVEKDKSNVASQNKKSDDDYTKDFLDINASKQAAVDAGLKSQISQSQFSISSINGSTNAQLRSEIPTINANFDAASVADQSEINLLTGKMASLNPADPKNVALIAQYQNMINSAKADQIQNPLAKAKYAKSLFDNDLATSDAKYNLDDIVSQYSGKSSDERSGFILGRERTLMGIANDPKSLLSDSERLGISTNVEKMEIARQQSAWKEQEGVLDIRKSAIDVQSATANTIGSPTDKLTAANSEITSNLERQAQLQKEINEGTANHAMTLEQIQQRKVEINELDAKNIELNANARRQFYADNEGIASNNLTSDTAGMSRTVRNGGNNAYDRTSALNDFNSKISTLTASLNDPINQGPIEQAAIKAQIATENAQKADFIENTNTYQASARENIENINAQGQFNRDLKNPFSDGYNVFGAGQKLLSLNSRSLSELESNRTGKRNAGTWSDVDEETYTRQKNGLLDTKSDIEYSERFAMFNAVPEMIAGAPSGGVGVSMFSTNALSAAFSPNPMVGGFGKKSVGDFDPSSLVTGNYGNRTFHGGRELEGGKSGDFMSHTMTVVDTNQETLKLLAKIAENTSGSRNTPNARPVQELGAVVNHNLNNSFNAYNPSAGR